MLSGQESVSLNLRFVNQKNYMSLNKIKINDSTVVNTGVVYDISKATNQTYNTLSDALGTSGNNVPPEVREGGMSIRYV